MTNFLIGLEFDVKHGAGVTTYRVNSRYRDAGYFECVAVDFAPVAPFKESDFLGTIQVFSRLDIEAAVKRFATAACKPLTADQRDGGARFEGRQNAGLDY